MTDQVPAPASAPAMWCDDFDADLLAVVPGAAEALGETAGVRLETFSRLTNGRINCPSAWNTHEGFVSFFWTAPQYRPIACYSTDDPVAECTFLEAIRDEWVHSATVEVNGRSVWLPPVRLMERLMYDVRGWTPLTGAEREESRARVRDSLEHAAARMQRVMEEAADG